MRFLLAALLALALTDAHATTFTDAAGRIVEVPEHPLHVLPAGPPAAVLLIGLAPDLMLGWPGDLGDASKALLAPEAASLKSVPRLTGRDDVVQKIVAWHPDLIVDFGDVAARYAALADRAQAATGTAAILLDGDLRRTPATIRALAGLLGRAERGEVMAKFAEQVLDSVKPATSPRRVVYARGEDGLNLIVPGTLQAQVFEIIGWQLAAPPTKPGESFRQSTIADVAALDPDLILLADGRAAKAIAESPEWQNLRAVRENHVAAAPALPFGWIEEPPSINRLAGLAWLSGQPAAEVTEQINALVYGRTLTPEQIQHVTAGTVNWP